MKPLKLTMSAFGSYADEITIDFSKVNNGIFLITGDTGSGKTTIFDAICYALYDRTSGGARESADMRSQYADPDRDTFVEYTFSYGEEIYTIRRKPKYYRVSKRKGKDGKYKETASQPEVELILPDQRVFQGKIKETNDKIIDIVGLDAEQFTQTVMIAQGEFMRLLQAPSNKRKEIFGRIFNTRIYWQIQEELKRQAKQIYIALEDNRKYCEREIASIQKLPNAAEDTEYIFKESESEEMLQGVEQLIDDGRQLEKDIKTEIKQNQKQLEEKNIVLSASEEVNKLFKQLGTAYMEKQKLELQETYIEELKQKLQSAKKAEIVEKEYDRYVISEKTLSDSTRRLQDLSSKLEEYREVSKEKEQAREKAVEQKEKEAPLLQSQILKLNEVMPAYKTAKQQKKKLDESKTDILKLNNEVDVCKQSLISIQQKLIEKHQQTVEYRQDYQNKSDEFIAEQAGILASNLKEGCPCPVCGSKEHPDKAKVSKNVVTQEQVDVAKNRWLDSDGEEARITEAVSEAKHNLDDKKEKLNSLQNAFETLQVEYNLITAQLVYSDEDEALRILKENNKKLQKLLDDAQTTEKQLNQIREKMTEVSGKKSAEEDARKRAEKERNSCEKKYTKAMSTQGFENEEEFLKARLRLSEVHACEQEISAYHDTCVRNQEKIKQLEKQTKGKVETDTSTLSQEIQLLQGVQKQLEKEHKNIFSINQRNVEIKDNLEKLLSDRNELKQQYNMYSTMDKTANGNLSGTAKMDFQTFIQRRYFEHMIREANKRLIKMTSNQFVLQCRSLENLGSQGAVGLDIDVYSLVNDKTRDVKTLSGGESFMAALAMALGMSDVIQNTAGRIKLDTMFVDEGFGSLDDESREEAIKILHELAGGKRLVGIISHVTELKEQIDRKLIVEKDENGSKARWDE